MADAADNFNRADEDPLAGNWTQLGAFSGLKVVSNRATRAGVDNYGIAVWNAAFQADQFSEAKLYTSSPTTIEPGLIVRGSQGGGSGDGYVLLWRLADGIQIYKLTAGSLSLLQNTSTAVVTGDTLKLSVEGSTLRAYVNGVQVNSDWTDSSYASGSPGIAAINGAEVDDWIGGPLVATSVVTGIFNRMIG